MELLGSWPKETFDVCLSEWKTRICGPNWFHNLYVGERIDQVWMWDELKVQKKLDPFLL